MHAHADASAPAQPWLAAARYAAQAAVDEAFNEALQDWSRAVATQQQQQQGGKQPPAGTSTSSKAAPHPPRVAVQDGTHVAVTIPLLADGDLRVVLAAIEAGLDRLAANSSRCSQQQQSFLLSTSRVVNYDLSRQAKPQQQQQQQQPWQQKQPRHHLSVQVVAPLQSSSPHESSGSSSSSSDGADSSSRGHVTVSKPAPFTADELQLLARLVAAANRPASTATSPGAQQQRKPSLFSDDPSWGLGSSSGSGSSSTLSGLAGGLGGALLGHIFNELLQDLQDGLQEQQQQQQPDHSSSDVQGGGAWTWQERMGRFFDCLPERLSSGHDTLGQAGQLPDDLQAHIQQLEQQLQQQLQAVAPPDIIDWLHKLTDQEGDRQQQQQKEQPEQQQPQQQQPPPPPPPLLPWEQPAAQAAVRQLQHLGAAVYLPLAAAAGSTGDDGAAAAAKGDAASSWGVLAGYDAQKQALEDTLLLPLKHPEIYERVAARTRPAAAKAGGARPRAVLFEGPPGTGKTSTARVLAGRASLPLVYVPLEMLVSKWYGESEKNMSQIFKACEALGGTIIFLDELDSLATSRDAGDMHEASRRLLGVLLREIDGFDHREGPAGASPATGAATIATSSSSSDGSGGDASRRSVVIGATNRPQDLDAALLSRFDLSVRFGLPDAGCRSAILQQYAHQLSDADRQQIAAATDGFSGRDLRDVAEQTERTWASRIIRGQVDGEQLPGLDDYLAAVRQRRQGAAASPSGDAGGAAAAAAGTQPPWLQGARRRRSMA